MKLSTSHTSAGISGITDQLVAIQLSRPGSVAPQHQLHELISFARFARSLSDAEILSAAVIDVAPGVAPGL